MEKTICELFAGVGGFRLGMERLGTGWKTVWFSQWEPKKKTQWAHDCYVKHFGECKDSKGEIRTGEDIATVDKENIPEHNLLVGGFPCQDYSVASTLANSKGLEGKKGVLWWQIRDVLIIKKPAFCLLENVDRLLKSPAKQRGRDFGIMLACLAELGYSVEWRVVNAASYGAAQRRRRVFIFAYRNDTIYGQRMKDESAENIILSIGFMQKAFPAKKASEATSVRLDENIVDISDKFSFHFENAGYMHGHEVHTMKISEIEEKPILLKEIIEAKVDSRFYIAADKLPKWEYLKGAKKIKRTAANGHEYSFSEGPVAFPDSLDKPGRTMLTSEGTLNRSSHAIADPGTGKTRIITPKEAERLQGFDDDWTKETISGEMPERMRYFCMGNALVVPMVTRMGKVLDEIFTEEHSKETEYEGKDFCRREQTVLQRAFGMCAP